MRHALGGPPGARGYAGLGARREAALGIRSAQGAGRRGARSARAAAADGRAIRSTDYSSSDYGVATRAVYSR